MLLKVVYAYIPNRDEQFYTSLNLDSRYAVKYVPGEWTKPILPGSKLLIFQNIAAAVAWLETLDRRMKWNVDGVPFMGKQLWWIEAEGVSRPQAPPLWAPRDSKIKEYWQGYPRIWPSGTPQSLAGTLYADRVRLFRTVMPYEIQNSLGHS